jgi:two-component system, response regulator PdtaR
VKVLIADDDLLIRSMLADMLAAMGHTVMAADNGVAAVDLCARSTFDCIILDFLMPKLSGVDALRQMRAAGVGAPVIILTAISDNSLRDVDGIREADGILEKPVTRRALEKALSRAVRQP